MTALKPYDFWLGDKYENSLSSPERPDPAVAPLWRTIGVGPTSINLTPEAMNDAAKNNGYVYVLQNGQTKSKDYSLKMVFRYTWGRG